VTVDPGVSAATVERAVRALRAMAYAQRLQILIVLRCGEATPSALADATGAHATVVSHHLRHLVDAGLVRRRRRSRQVFYSLSSEETGDLLDTVLGYAGG
jgi:DNA-binding transcriptional ArsR family regulator